jgi:hypothetical protein
MFNIFYKYYLLKISELKNQLLKLKIWDLITYSVVCCPIHLGDSVLIVFQSPPINMKNMTIYGGEIILM